MKVSPDLWQTPLVYVAGPYTNPDPVLNTHDACVIGSQLIDSGLCGVVIPHPTLVWHMVTPRPLEDWYAIDLAVLARCDAVYRFPGRSTGADAEVEFALARHIPVFFEVPELLSWLEQVGGVHDTYEQCSECGNKAPALGACPKCGAS